MTERLAITRPPIPDRSKYLMEQAMNFETGQIFLTALDMGIFDLLKEKKSADEVAENLSTRPDITVKFLDVLVGMGLLEKSGREYVTETTLRPHIVKDEPYFARYLNFTVESRDLWNNLPQLMKNGPQKQENDHKHEYDRASIEWIARGCMLGRLQSTLSIVCSLPEFSQARRLIDFGGGHGLFGIGMAQENPDLEVAVFDQPGITEITRDYIKKYRMEERVRTITGNYLTDDPGSGYDIAFEACSFGGNTREALSFYRNAARSLKTGGLFVTQTFTFDDDRKNPLSSLIWDLKDSISGGGKGHMHMKTNSELFSLFEQAGLSGEQIIEMPSGSAMPMRIITARKSE